MLYTLRTCTLINVIFFTITLPVISAYLKKRIRVQLPFCYTMELLFTENKLLLFTENKLNPKYMKARV